MKKFIFSVLLMSAFVACNDKEDEEIIGNKENGHEWVDLGLSVKWATCNIGASRPEEYGSYIAWGETETATKSSYDWSTYKFQAEFIGDNKTILEKDDDAAAVNWGGDWVMPSPDDFIELLQYCTCTWTTQNGVNGYLIASSNGNSIFLPAAGFRAGGDLSFEGSFGYYWMSSLGAGDSRNGRTLRFYSGDFSPWFDNYRCYGQSVRPVCPSAGNTNGHVTVDLGLPSGKLWADCNVGASTPETNGDYIAWGETEAREVFYWSRYKFMQNEIVDDGNLVNKYQALDGQYRCIWYRFEKYSYDDNKTTLEKNDDAATVNWGDNWRIPTAAEWEELYSNTTRTWTNDYEGTGVKGYILTSTKEGHEDVSIFLPAAGCRSYVDLYDAGSYGYYWSSSSLVGNIQGNGRELFFGEDYFYHWYFGDRYYGQSVRPVCQK